MENGKYVLPVTLLCVWEMKMIELQLLCETTITEAKGIVSLLIIGGHTQAATFICNVLVSTLI